MVLKWSAEDIQILCKNYQKFSALEMIPMLSVPRTEAAVENKLQILRRKGLIKQKEQQWTKGEEQEVAKLFYQGLSLVDIAGRVGRTPRAVHAKLSRLDKGKESRGLDKILWYKLQSHGFVTVESKYWPLSGELGPNTVGMIVHPTILKHDGNKFIKEMRKYTLDNEGSVTRVNFIVAESPSDFKKRQEVRRAHLNNGFITPSDMSRETFNAWMIADGTTKLESNGVYTGELLQTFTLQEKNSASHAEYMISTFNQLEIQELTSRALSLERNLLYKNPSPGQHQYNWRLRLSLNNWSIFQKTLDDFYLKNPNGSSRNYKCMPPVDVLVSDYLTSNRVLSLIYMQDGGLMNAYKTIKLTISSTNKTSCTRLIVALYKAYGLRFIRNEAVDNKRPGFKLFTLFLCYDDLELFIKIVQPNLHSCMLYKMPPSAWLSAARMNDNMISANAFKASYQEYCKVAQEPYV